MQEVWNIVKSCGAYKAPGPDEFQAIFYQSQWQIIGPSLLQLVQDIFNQPERIADLNETFISLIPKLDVVTSMKQFRPIGLCNVSYKVITKLISTRLREAFTIWWDLRNALFPQTSRPGQHHGGSRDFPLYGTT